MTNDENVIENRKESLIKYVLDDLPEHINPVFINCAGKCYPRKAVADYVIKCFEEVIQRIIDTSQTPQGLLRRIAAFRAHPNTKIMIWTESFRRVLANVKPRTEQELRKEFGEKYHLVNLEELV